MLASETSLPFVADIDLSYNLLPIVVPRAADPPPRPAPPVKFLKVVAAESVERRLARPDAAGEDDVVKPVPAGVPVPTLDLAEDSMPPPEDDGESPV